MEQLTAIERTAAAVVVNNTRPEDVPIVLSVLGYQLRTPIVVEPGDVVEVCVNGHPKNRTNLGRHSTTGVPFCKACAADRRVSKREREQGGR